MKSAAWLIVATLTATAACAYQITGYSEQPKTVSLAKARYTYVVVNWVKDVDELLAACSPVDGRIIEACAYPRRDKMFPDTYSCTIWAIQPNDFNDSAKLAILGHEFWHCLGAEHERN